MQIRAIEGMIARCEAGGVERDVSLFMLPEDSVRPGEYVMVHVGYAIQKMTPQEARSTWELYDEMLGMQDEDSGHAKADRSAFDP
jgi:hydrogenase expression/formation protein HypC